MAARHFINDQSSCGTAGDSSGNTFEEILSKYYAYSAVDVKYQIIDFPDYDENLDAGRYFMEYILTMDDVDKDFLMQDQSFFIGIACSCGQEEEFRTWSAERTHWCIFAQAGDIWQKLVVERVPAYAPLLAAG